VSHLLCKSMFGNNANAVRAGADSSKTPRTSPFGLGRRDRALSNPGHG
jgi:hypothetical protein